MTNYIKKNYLLLAFFGILIFLLLPAGTNAIVLSPTKQTLVIKPGKSELIKLDIINDSASTKVVSPEMEGFKVDDKTGRPIFGQRDEAILWITPTKNEMVLKPGGKGTFSFTVTAPRDAQAFGHYITLFAKEKNTGGQIGVSSRVGSLLFLYIEGTINENLSLISFSAEKQISEGKSVKLFLALKNTGNIHLVPAGEIVIKNRTGKIISKLNVNQLNRKVLPNGIWSGEYTLPLQFSVSSIGLINADVNLTYGLTKQKMGANTTFWYLPMGAIIYLFEFCLLVLFVVLIAKKYLRIKK